MSRPYTSIGLEIGEHLTKESRQDILTSLTFMMHHWKNTFDFDGEIIIVTYSENSAQGIESYFKSQVPITGYSAPVSILYPDVDTKPWSKATLFIENAIGDRLIYLRDLSCFAETEINKIINQLSFNKHLEWIHLDYTGKSLYSKLNSAYRREIVPSFAVGFNASRQVINAVLRRNDNIYDVFIELGLIVKSASHQMFKSFKPYHEIYSKIEMNRVLIKHVSPYQPSIFHWPLVFAICISIVETIMGLLMWCYGYHEALITVSPILAVVVISIINIGIDNIILSRQIAAKLDGKRVAGRASKKMVIV